MKRFKISGLIISICIFSCQDDDISGCCECSEAFESVSPYLYPEVDTELPYTEKVAKVQLPENILKNICTADLIESYLEYPFISSLVMRNNVRLSFESILESFNGARELVARRDVFIQLFKRYDANNFSNFDTSWTTERKVRYKFNLLLLDITLSQHQILDTAPIGLKNELLKSAMVVYELRQLNPEFFSINNSSNDFLIMNVLFSTDYLPFKEFVSSHPSTKRFLEGFMAVGLTDEEKSEFTELLKKYLKTLEK